MQPGVEIYVQIRPWNVRKYEQKFQGHKWWDPI